MPMGSALLVWLATILAYRSGAAYWRLKVDPLLTSVSHTLEKAAVYLAECRSMGITVEVPDINRSAANFTPGDKSIIFGLAAVRNVGEGLVDLIVTEREAREELRATSE